MTYRRPFLLCMPVAVVLLLSMSCSPSRPAEGLAPRIDSLFVKLRCTHTLTQLIQNNYILSGQKKVRYKMEYIRETWPDTITRAQAAKIIYLKDLGIGYEELANMSRSLGEQANLQLEQLKKLNTAIATGADADSLRQYLNFESKCADTLSMALDTLVKRSIELSCKSQSL